METDVEHELGIEEIEEEEKIYIAVKKELKEGKSTLLWLLQNANKENKVKIVITHVHIPAQMIPFMGSKFPASKIKEQVVKEYRQSERAIILEKLDSYVNICMQLKIQAEKLVIDSDNVAKGLVELISLHGIERLVMGAAADKYFSRKMKTPKSQTAITVRQQANSSCQIWFVCKGNLICTREFSHDTKSMGTPSPALSLSTPSSFRSVQLRSRSMPEIHLQVPTPELPSQMSLPNSSRTTASISQSRMILQTSLVTDPGDETSEGFQSSSSTFSSITNDMFSNLNTMSVAKSGESEEGLVMLPLTEHSIEDASIVSSQNDMDNDIDAEVYSRLQEAYLEAEKSDRKAHQESIKRQKAERDVIEALRRAKTFEVLYAKEMERRKEVEASLARETMEVELLKNQSSKTFEQLQTANDQKLELELKIADSTKELVEVKLLHSKLKAEYEELELERDAILEEVGRTKEAAGINSTNIHNFTEFSLLEIETATCNFSDSLKIGEGGYGNVYKGLLRNTTVAIKVLNPDSMQGISEFHHEVYVLSRVRHPNLITLIGVCIELSALIYEYLPNGSLEDHLNHNTSPLPWQPRTRILTEICSALLFLHSNKPHTIVHGDLKPENVLLDHTLMAKLGDFGICRLLTQSTTSHTLCHYTLPKGTFVYMDPEYLATGELTPKSDVYSFGVVMLRILTGRQPFGIVKEVKNALDRNTLHELIDGGAGEWPYVQAKRLAELGVWCCEVARRKRPDLGDVWRVLEPMTRITTSSFVYEDDVPSYFICPIFQEIMRDPHIASDGFTYEAEALKGWIESGRDTSPMTNLSLLNYDLIPNRALRSAIQEWMQKHAML